MYSTSWTRSWSGAFRTYRESLLIVLGAAFLLALIPAGIIMRRRMLTGFVIPMLAGLGLALAAGTAAGTFDQTAAASVQKPEIASEGAVLMDAAA